MELKKKKKKKKNHEQGQGTNIHQTLAKHD